MLLTNIYCHLATVILPIFAPVRHRFTEIMPSISEIILLFKTTRKSFASIDGHPGDDNMILLRETLPNIFLSIRFVVIDAGYESDVVLSEDAYL